jgi:hypothetical protein
VGDLLGLLSRVCRRDSGDSAGPPRPLLLCQTSVDMCVSDSK